MRKKIIAVVLIILISSGIFSGCLGQQNQVQNRPPSVMILSPQNGAKVSNMVIVQGDASDPDGNTTLRNVQVKIDEGDWNSANGTAQWNFRWITNNVQNGAHQISVRSWDGSSYSNIVSIEITLLNPLTIEYGTHKWAVFIIAANFPAENSSKLGNGGLYLAENMTAFFIQKYNYSTSNIVILFDDGWIRRDNGYGSPIETLQQRSHPYNITYGGATKQNVTLILQQVVEESNAYDDSEVFIWLFNHGYGDSSKPLTGGKILQNSAISLWDAPLSDAELGQMVMTLNSTKTCIVVDACYSGGFADKTIYNIPEFFGLNSGIAQPGRIVISGTSKFRPGYAITVLGPIFSLIWFDALQGVAADGFKPGFLHRGRPSGSKDGKTSVEEAFYYTCYVLRRDKTLVNFRMMEPQINDQYPKKGVLQNMGEMLL